MLFISEVSGNVQIVKMVSTTEEMGSFPEKVCHGGVSDIFLNLFCDAT